MVLVVFSPGEGHSHRDLFRLLHVVIHGKEVAASTCLAIIFRRIASGIPLLNSGANAAPVLVLALPEQCHYSRVQALAVVALKQQAIECYLVIHYVTHVG